MTLNGSSSVRGRRPLLLEWGAGSLGEPDRLPPGCSAHTERRNSTSASGSVTSSPRPSYQYRIVADDSFGTTIGSVQTFSTLGRNQFAAYYGSSGSGDGQLDEPSDVAVDNSTGDIYVADKGNHRVVKFDSSGNFLSAWGWGVGGGSHFEVSTGCHAGIPGNGAGQLSKPFFIEVDNSVGPSSGDVYVAGRNTRGTSRSLGRGAT